MIVDPFAIPEPAYWLGNHDASGYAQSNPRLVSGERTAVFIAFGQSLAASYGGGPIYTPAHPSKVDQINIFDGGCYAYKDPMLGATGSVSGLTTGGYGGGSNWARMADKLIDAGWCDRVIVSGVAVGGTSVAQWDKASNLLWPRLQVAIERLKALGLPLTAILSQIGEQDNSIGTGQAEYAGSMNNIIGATRMIGVTAPWFLGKSTKYVSATGSNPSPTIRAAVQSLVNGNSVRLGADIDTIPNSGRIDTVHMNSTGLDTSASLWKAVLMASLSVS